MDWGHVTLGGALLIAAALVLLRRRHRELHIRIDWKEQHDGDPADRHRQR